MSYIIYFSNFIESIFNPFNLHLIKKIKKNQNLNSSEARFVKKEKNRKMCSRPLGSEESKIKSVLRRNSNLQISLYPSEVG